MTTGQSRGRLLAFDFARGLAVVAMVQAHAYGAWVRAPERSGLAFRFTRFVATIPLPAFLLLAGIGLSMRVENARRRGEHAAKVRLELVRRGFEIVAAGYAVSLLGFVIDGGEFVPTVFRADVLHAIGLSLALYAAVSVRGGAGEPPDGRVLLVRSGVLAVLLAAGSVPLTRLARTTAGLARFFVAPFAEVPGLTKMPLVPLGAWLGLGVLLAHVLTWSRATTRDPDAAIAGADRKLLVALAIGGSALATVAYVAMDRTVAWLGGPLDRAHPAIVWNVVDLGARSVVLVALSGLALPHLPSRLVEPVLVLGRHSLLGYAFHLPLAYGRIPRGIEGRLSMLASTALVIVLVAATYGATRLADVVETRRTTGG